MTVRALQRGMHPDERESGVLEMIKARAIPGVHTAVTLFARSGEPGSAVNRRRCLLVVLGVAGVTLRRKSLKLSSGRSLVAGVAFECGVCADQREPVLVLLDLL